MRDRTNLGQTMGLLIILLSLTGFTALGKTPDPSPGPFMLTALAVTDIDCADLITADTIGHEEFERYGIAERLRNNAFMAHEYLGYIVCGTGQPRSDENILGLFSGTYYMFEAESGELAVTYIEWEGPPAESTQTPPAEPRTTPTPMPLSGIVDAAGDDSQMTTVCIDATTPILEIGGENPEQFDFWGLLANAPCGLEMSNSICLDCGEDVLGRWLVPTLTGQGQEPAASLEGRGGRICFDAQMAAQITGQELDEDDASRLASGACSVQFGPGDQVCWQCMEDMPELTPEPTLTPVPSERARKDPVCSDYVTPETVGLEAWEKYGIADKLQSNQIQRHLSKVSDRIVCYGHRTIDGVGIAADELYYMFDIESGELLRVRIHWREDLPEYLPSPRISQQEAEAMVEGTVTHSSLAIFSPDGSMDILGRYDMPSGYAKPSFQDPCWAVSSREGGDLDIPWVTIINAMTGRKVGRYCPC